MRAYIDPRDEYVLQAWSEALQKHGVDICTEKPAAEKVELWYEDYDSYDFETRDAKAEWVYSYVYRKALTRKNFLDNTIRHYCAKRPDSILHTSWPESFRFEVDFPEFLDDALDESWELKQELAADEGKVWILKPALGERAAGVHVFKTQDDLQKIMDTEFVSVDEDGETEMNTMREFVVQKYITDPWLIDERKFHFRVYVLCVGRIQVYVNRHVLMLFSGSKYNPSDYSDRKSHLTNTCFQGQDARVEAIDLSTTDKFGKDVYKQLCDTIHDLFDAAMGQPIHFQPCKNAFEFYGLDFVLNSKSELKLLEVNAYPDFKQTGKLNHIIQNLFADTLDVVLNKKSDNGLDLVYSSEK